MAVHARENVCTTGGVLAAARLTVYASLGATNKTISLVFDRKHQSLLYLDDARAPLNQTAAILRPIVLAFVAFVFARGDHQSTINKRQKHAWNMPYCK